ncbi:hypothetical protein C8R45DRAFT_1135689 [Mycena sanguinolenta]|nr:hypothetical protein C8R45DRAFT_1135689 [Mycena sanguinolenta]
MRDGGSRRRVSDFFIRLFSLGIFADVVGDWLFVFCVSLLGYSEGLSRFDHLEGFFRGVFLLCCVFHCVRFFICVRRAGVLRASVHAYGGGCLARRLGDFSPSFCCGGAGASHSCICGSLLGVLFLAFSAFFMASFCISWFCTSSCAAFLSRSLLRLCALPLSR